MGLDTKRMLEEFQAFVDSPEGQAHFDAIREKNKQEKKMKKYHLKRFHQKFGDRFGEIVDRLVAKYESNEYVDKCYSKGYEPDTPMLWFIFEYVCKKGRKCTKKEWKKHANMFTGALRYYNGYFFNVMHGQGSVIHVIKEEA